MMPCIIQGYRNVLLEMDSTVRPTATITTTAIVIVENESAVEGWERVRTHYQFEDPSPTQPTHGRKKRENSESRNERADQANKKALALHLEGDRQ